MLQTWWRGLTSAESTKRLWKEGLWVTLGQLTSALGLLLGMRLLTELVPPGVFGEVSLLIGVLAFGSSLLCFPWLQASLRFYPDLVLGGNVHRLRSTVGRFLVRMTAILIGCILIGGMVVSLWEGVSYWVFVVLSLLLAAETAATFETNLLSAARRQRSLAIWRIGEAWCRPTLAVLAVLALGSSPQAVLLGYAVGSAGILLAFIAFGHREGSTGEAIVPSADDELSIAVRRYALPLMPLAVVGWVNSLSDRFLIGGLLGPEAVGLYAAAYGLMTRPFLMAAGSLLLTLRPSYFEAVARGDSATERKILRLWMVATVGVCVLGVLGVFLLKEMVTDLLLAEQYRSSAVLLPMLATGISMMIVSQVFNSVSLAHKRPQRVLYSEAAGAVAALGLGIPLILVFGLWGAALATALAYLVQMVTAYGLARSAASASALATPGSCPNQGKPSMLQSLLKLILSAVGRCILGRRNRVRLGQFILNEARLDRVNDFDANGEQLVQERVADLAQKGNRACVILDVGANIGEWSRHFALRLSKANVPFTIFAFEPLPETFAILSTNLNTWNIADKVQPCNIAISAIPGERTFYSVGAGQGRNSLHAPLDGYNVSTSVKCATLDQWRAEKGIENIWFVKIDTEGHDLEVLHGAKDLLKSGGIEMLQFEYNHRWITARRFLLDAFELLGPCGYRIGKITKDGIEFYKQWDLELESFREGNYLAVKEKYVTAFPAIRWWKA